MGDEGRSLFDLGKKAIRVVVLRVRSLFDFEGIGDLSVEISYQAIEQTL